MPVRTVAFIRVRGVLVQRYGLQRHVHSVAMQGKRVLGRHARCLVPYPSKETTRRVNLFPGFIEAQLQAVLEEFRLVGGEVTP